MNADLCRKQFEVMKKQKITADNIVKALNKYGCPQSFLEQIKADMTGAAVQIIDPQEVVIEAYAMLRSFKQGSQVDSVKIKLICQQLENNYLQAASKYKYAKFRKNLQRDPERNDEKLQKQPDDLEKKPLIALFDNIKDLTLLQDSNFNQLVFMLFKYQYYQITLTYSDIAKFAYKVVTEINRMLDTLYIIMACKNCQLSGEDIVSCQQNNEYFCGRAIFSINKQMCPVKIAIFNTDLDGNMDVDFYSDQIFAQYLNAVCSNE